jgi:hypothetical protein
VFFGWPVRTDRRVPCFPGRFPDPSSAGVVTILPVAGEPLVQLHRKVPA